MCERAGGAKLTIGLNTNVFVSQRTIWNELPSELSFLGSFGAFRGRVVWILIYLLLLIAFHWFVILRCREIV
jgi:hypothetical protein